MLLALAGSAAGVVVGQWGVRLLVGQLPAEAPRVAGIALDGTVLTATLVAAIVTGLLFGVLPAVNAGQLRLEEALRQGGVRAGARAGGSFTCSPWRRSRSPSCWSPAPD